MQLARENQVQSIAFPSISTGVYAYPIEKAAAIALRTVADELGKSPGIKTVRFVLFDERTFRCYSMELDLLMSKEIRTG
jgi:O-acetyl-ADP-ribose deacetylase (regulator of RNase III)